MRIRKALSINARVAITISFAACLTLLACSINVDKDKSGEEKKVDIETPLGGIHVDKDAEARDTGLAVYPGARLKPQSASHDDNDANVNLSFMNYGLKVVAMEYESDDTPDRIVAFYQDQLKKYGDVLECHTTGTNVQMNHKQGSNQVACDAHTGKTIELKVGTPQNQRIVSIDPRGNGTSFTLVYVHTSTGSTI